MKAGVQSPLKEVGGGSAWAGLYWKSTAPKPVVYCPLELPHPGWGRWGGQFLQSQKDPRYQSIKVQKIKRGQFTYVMSLKLHKTPRRDVFFYFDYYYLHFTTNFILLLIMTIIQQLL